MVHNAISVTKKTDQTKLIVIFICIVFEVLKVSAYQIREVERYLHTMFIIY